MVSDAAPHSSASICITTGTFAAPFFIGCFIGLVFVLIGSPQFRINDIGETLSVTISALYVPSESAELAVTS